MSVFASEIHHVITRHHMLTLNDSVLVGVSGGADSVALLLVLRDLGYRLAIGHVNHGLRGIDSVEDEAFVADLAQRLAIPFHNQRIDVAATGGNLEAAGRRARKDFFSGICGEHGYTKIALGHNRDDRVETFLLHLMRGSGAEGLVSMWPVHENTVRPLIESPRSEIERYLGSLGQTWRTDRTNLDISFARNRIRHEILPQLTSLFNTRLAEGLARTVAVLQDEEEWLAEITETWIARKAQITKEAVAIDAVSLSASPVALARRVIRSALRHAGSDLNNVTFDHVEAIRGLLEEGKSGKTIQVPGGRVGTREFDWLVIRRPPDIVNEFSHDLIIPGVVHIPELKSSVRAEIVERAESLDGNSRVFADADRTGSRILIRNWKPGDYYRPAGWPAGKVKRLFQRSRVPKMQRSCLPVLVSGSALVWVVSFPVSRDFAVSNRSEKIVAFDTLPD